MIKENQAILNRIQILIDVLAIILAMVAAYYIRFADYQEGIYLTLDYYIRALFVIIPLYLFLYSLFGLYLPHRTKSRTEEALNIIKVNIIGIILLISGMFVIKEIDYSRIVLVLFVCFSIAFTIGERLLVRMTLRYYRKKGFNLKHILVIGAGDLGQEFVKRVKNNKELGYNVIGFIDDKKSIGRNVKGVSVLGRLHELEEILDKYKPDEIVVTLPLKEYDSLKEIIQIGEKIGVKVKIVPDYLKYIPARPHADEIDGMPLIHTRYIPLDNIANRFVKRLTDIVLATFFITITSPVMITAAILIKLSSPGPVIFKQERVGINNKNFVMYKFRSMKVQTDEESDTVWTTKDDPRKTRIGDFIRKTSIDELPQFFNVLFGTMSMIGPRPERPYFVEQFKEKIPKYMIKHQVRPGITGWAQVNGWRGDTSIEERIKCDIYYIENWSLALDIKIIIMTVFKGLINKNAY